jgi:hypothetical protein
MLKPGPEGQEPERHAVQHVHETEGEKVKQSGSILDQVKQMYDKDLKAMTARTGGVPWTVPSVAWFIRAHSSFQHFLSLPVQKIQNVVWDKQIPNDLIAGFEVAEKEWQEQTKGKLKPNLEPVWNSEEAQQLQSLKEKLKKEEATNEDPDRIYRMKKEIARLEAEIAETGEQAEVDTVFLQFQDGWAWWKLSRAYCSEEAKAMGHCGNVVGQEKTDERILSLRKPVKAGKEDMWEPHLTFILEPNGLLGEMKGKANAKPTAAYHKYIVSLLEDPRIKGIRGGGYAPERNFSMDDLPKETQDELIAKKPGLMNCQMYLKRVGSDASLIERINSMLEWGLHHSSELGGFVLNHYPTLDAFIQEQGNDDAKYIGKVLTGDEDIDTDYDYGQWEYAVDNLTSKTQPLVATYIEETYPDEVAGVQRRHRRRVRRQ